jgi:uncharacterized membrane protein YhaH (DUF805 family)
MAAGQDIELLTRPWRHWADFRGRSRRLEALLFLATVLAGAVVVGAVGEVVMNLTGTSLPPLSLGNQFVALTIRPHGWPLLLYFALCFVPGLALSVRRLHDYGLSGFLLLAWLVPLLGQFVGLVLAIAILFLRDPREAARFGPDPRESEVDTDALGSVFA